jgi:hypothetical protein
MMKRNAGLCLPVYFVWIDRVTAPQDHSKGPNGCKGNTNFLNAEILINEMTTSEGGWPV